MSPHAVRKADVALRRRIDIWTCLSLTRGKEDATRDVRPSPQSPWKPIVTIQRHERIARSSTPIKRFYATCSIEYLLCVQPDKPVISPPETPCTY